MAGLYIHIPFCHSKCAYCDFYSTPGGGLNHERYIEALALEWRKRSSELGGHAVETVYLGGGTPSILSVDSLKRLMDFIPIDNSVEFTIEVNPEDVTDEMVSFIAESPINRVSMGVQSMVDAELLSVGRRHTSGQVVEAVGRIRKAGVDNLSLDLIYGLPGQNERTWRYSLDAVMDLSPEHLSSYSLMLEPGTRLWAMSQTGRFIESPQELSERMYRILCDRAADCGFEHYEISNFSMPGKESLHNSNYWNLTPYLGLGASAHSYDGNVRRFNPASVSRYIESPGDSFSTESITEEQRCNEYLLIRLRTRQGLSLDDFESRFGSERMRILLHDASSYLSSGTVVIDGARFFIPECHWLISDSILVDLFK